jgi:hypothetical protein
MEYLIGVLLALAVAGFATVIGLDRGRAFYPTVLIVIATYYVLFAVMGASGRILGMEIAGAAGFSSLAIIGFKKNLWLVPFHSGFLVLWIYGDEENDLQRTRAVGCAVSPQGCLTQPFAFRK